MDYEADKANLRSERGYKKDDTNYWVFGGIIGSILTAFLLLS